jgi:hypothetical protein
VLTGFSLGLEFIGLGCTRKGSWWLAVKEPDPHTDMRSIDIIKAQNKQVMRSKPHGELLAVPAPSLNQLWSVVPPSNLVQRRPIMTD